jgi:hypothetical protein
MGSSKFVRSLAAVVACGALAVVLAGCHPTRWGVAADYSNAYNWNRCASSGVTVDIGTGWYSGWGYGYHSAPGWYDCYSGWGRGWGHSYGSGWSHSWGGGYGYGYGYGGRGRGCGN